MSERWLRPWALALATAIPLTVLYLIVQPPSGDLAAATYRSEVFAHSGLTIWDNGWYGGHYLPGYSVLAPALGALAGERLLLGLCTIAAAGLFGTIAQKIFEADGARIAAVSFALGVSVTMLSGRVAFGLGLAVGLLAVVALQHGRLLPALVLAVLASLSSPVAGAFLALAGAAYALAAAASPALGGESPVEAPHARGRARARVGRPKTLHIPSRWSALWLGRSFRKKGTPEGVTPRLKDLPKRLGGRATQRGLALAAAALAPILLLTLAFPEGGWEPFAPSVFWPGLAGVVLIALLLPRVDSGLTPPAVRALTAGAWLYALALIGSFALHTPVGSNAARLGELLAAPLVAGALWKRRPTGSEESGRLRHPLVLLALAAALLYWQLETPINDVSALAGDPSVNASFYAPLVGELQRRAHGLPLRVEVPQTGAHRESVYLPEHGSILLARGWERQLDTRLASLFYAPALTASVYRGWLYENAISYVALPDVRLDFAATAEGRLVARGLPYLREVWRSAHWRLFAVAGAPALATPPARLTAVGAQSFTLAAPRRGSYEVRVRYTPYWGIQHDHGCVRRAPGGWTIVQARAAGTIRVGIDFSLTRIFNQGPRCA